MLPLISLKPHKTIFRMRSPLPYLSEQPTCLYRKALSLGWGFPLLLAAAYALDHLHCAAEELSQIRFNVIFYFHDFVLGRKATL
jgi:hypothetical protein